MLAGVERIKVVSPTQVWLRDSATYFARPAQIVRDYSRKNLRPDLLAGLTVAVVMLPQAIAYALIAELPPETGLYAAIVAAIIGSLWGSSSHLHTGPTNAASLLVLSTLLPLATPGTPEYLAAAGLLAVMVGVIRLVMGLARLGVLVNFVSDSVIIGFTAGAGILISVNQLRHLFRLSIPSSPSFIDTLLAVSANIPTTHLISAAIGLGTIILMAHLNKFIRWSLMMIFNTSSKPIAGRFVPSWPPSLSAVHFTLAPPNTSKR
jgi:SulP family sulfate permease